MFSKDKEITLPGLMSLQECRSESDFKENLIGSAFQGYSAALSPNNYQSVKQNTASQQQRYDSQQSLRVNKTNSALENQQKSQNQPVPIKNSRLFEINGGVSQSVKNSCDHSVISPNYRTQNNATSTTNKNNKQPFNSIVPNAINKNLNKKDSKNSQSQHSKGIYSYDMATKEIRTPLSEDSADFILSGQNTIQNQNQMLFNVNSFQNLTPQKNQPTPISPSQRPVQSNYGGKIVMINSNNIQPTNQQQYDSRNFNNQMPSSLRTQNSGQKATVVYNEFKYYTSGADLNNTQNPQKYINITAGQQRKSDISASHISGMPVTLHYELSPGNQNNMFDVASPKQSISNGQQSFNVGQSNSGANIRANSLRKQIYNTDRNHHQTSSQQQTVLLPSSQNYQLQLKQENSTNNIQQENVNQEAQVKIRELQNYIEQLEGDLKESQDKNVELKQKFKDKSFIQSFDKNKKHLSDTEDSLILSEKKGRKNSIQHSQNIRNSLSKQNNTLLPGNSSVIQCSTSNQQSNLITNSNSNCPDLNPNLQPQQQRSSSIVDVKIRPIVNLKNYQQNINQENEQFSPQNLIRNSGSFANKLTSTNQQQRRNIEQESDNQLEYQVQDYNDYSASQLNQSNQGVDQNDSQVQNHQHLSEDECEGCERLKQLVFQAKEAIDDLKLEIEEWRDICSDKETELRQLHHRIYNDIMGVDKKLEFNQDIQTKEFDPSHPVTSYEQRKVRNYINHNKNRIRSRSKTANNAISNKLDSNLQSKRSGINIAQCLKKKSALKNITDLASEQFEFYEAEDRGLQTSFEGDKVHSNMQIQHSTEQMQTNVSIDSSSNMQGQNRKHQNNGMLSQYTNNRKTISPEKQLILQSHQYDTVSVNLKTTQPDDYLEELCSLRTKNQLQEQEIHKMRSQMSMMTGQIEKFINLMQKAKKRNYKKSNNIDIEDIKQNHELISNIESYSILEKINEWKREEGLIDQNTLQDQEPLPTQIPRPLKLIQDIDISELDMLEQIKPNQHVTNNQLQSLQLLQSSQQQQQQQHLINFNNISNINQLHNNSSVLQQSVVQQNNSKQQLQYQSQMDNAQEFLQLIKIEQENIKRQTDQKYKELQKQQQDYLNVLKGV